MSFKYNTGLCNITAGGPKIRGAPRGAACGSGQPHHEGSDDALLRALATLCAPRPPPP